MRVDGFRAAMGLLPAVMEEDGAGTLGFLGQMGVMEICLTGMVGGGIFTVCVFPASLLRSLCSNRCLFPSFLIKLCCGFT